MASHARPLLVVNPPDDAVFARTARDLTARCQTPDDLRRLLSERYPRVLVRERALSGELARVWYVYRDGRWTRGKTVTQQRG